MNQIELEKIAESFDGDHDSFNDLTEINAILRGICKTCSLTKRPVTNSEKIEQEARRVQRGSDYIAMGGIGRMRGSKRRKTMLFVVILCINGTLFLLYIYFFRYLYDILIFCFIVKFEGENNVIHL